MHKGYDYGRSHNPTRFAFERCVADLEEGTAGFAFASGLAAIATVLELLDAGSHVLVCDDIYGGSYRLFERVRRRRANLDFSYVDPADLGKFAAAIRPNDAIDLDRKPLKSAVEAGRPGGDCRISMAPQRLARQHVRHSVCSAAACAGLRHGGAFGHQVPQWPFGHDRRSGRVGGRQALSSRWVFCKTPSGELPGPSTAFSHCVA